MTEFARVWDMEPRTAQLNAARSDLLMALRDEIEGLSNADAANKLNATEPVIVDLLHGKISLFRLDVLVLMATAAGLKVTLDIQK